MKILFISSEAPYPDNSGGRIYTWQKIKQLSGAGNEIYLVSFNDLDEPITEIYSRYVKETYFYQRGFMPLKLITSIWEPFSLSTRRLLLMQKKIATLIKEKKIDLVILDFIYMYYNLARADLGGVPVVLVQHNLEHQSFLSIAMEARDLPRRIIYRLESWKIKRLMRRLHERKFFAGMIFISPADAKAYGREFGKIKHLVLPPAVTGVRNWAEKRRVESGSLVFTGAMCWPPNVFAVSWLVRKVMPKIWAVMPEAKLYIVGRSPTAPVRSLASERVIVTGTVPTTLPYLRKANVVVTPLLAGGGIKLKLFEALQTGNIVVTTPQGKAGTVFKDGEDLFVASGSKQFAKVCLKNLRKPNWQVAKHGNATLQKNYNFSAAKQSLRSFLKEIMR